MPNLPGFIGPSYTLRSVNVDCQRCVNWFPEKNELGTGKDQEVASLPYTPGLRLFLKYPTLGAQRGMYVASNDRLFAVIGAQLLEINGSIVTTLGTLNTKVGPVSIADNGVQMILVDGANGYLFTFATKAFAQITVANFPNSTGFPGGTKVAFQDGYFIVNQPRTKNFFFSGIFDGTSWDPLDFGVKEGDPGNIISIVDDHRELWLFGTNSTEVWYNSGDALSPFARLQGAFIEHGCAAAFSVQKLDNSLFWVGQDRDGRGLVWRAAGYVPTRISTFAVEQAIQGYGDISDATSYTYQQDGHSFYVLNFPGADTTWVYDVASGLWHERRSTDPISKLQSRHLADNHVFYQGKHLVGDYNSVNLYEMTAAALTDNALPIVKMRTFPHISSDLKEVYYNSLQIDLEAGVGLDGIQQGTDPQIMMQFSDDGGHTWSSEKWASMGKIGQYKRRAIWRRLGRSRDRVFRVMVSDPVPVTLIAAIIEYAQGNN